MNPAPSFRAALAALALAAAPQTQEAYDQFVKDFRAALAASDGELMASLVKHHSNEAAWHVDKVCTAISESPTEDVEKEAQALVAAWNAGNGTDFAANYYEFLSLIRPEERRERTRLVGAYERALTKFIANTTGAKDGIAYDQVAVEAEGLAGAFAGLGDHFKAADCWRLSALCYDEGHRKPSEVDGPRAAASYLRALENYDRAEIQHAVYVETKARHTSLAGAPPRAGGDSPAAAASTAVEAAPEATTPSGAPVTLAMSFEALEGVEQFARPNYCADEMYQSWPWLLFTAKGGAAAEFPAHGQAGPLLMRVAAAEIGLDSDRDGKGETSIRLTGKLTAVECELTRDGTTRPWAFAMITGIAADRYQGLAYYLEPLDAYFYTFFLAAGSMLGTLGDTELRVIDENCDGTYGGQPLTWAYYGLTEGNYHPEFDSLVIGDSERALPWSEYVRIPQVKGTWHKLEPQGGGTALVATPVEVETGRLELAFEGPPVTWLVVRGEGPLANSYFDLLADPRNGVEVPVGTYVLFAGEVRKGKKQQASKALILPPKDPLRWTVEPGKTTTVELGGPFGFDFKAARTHDGVTVLGKSVVVVGARGERYERPWNCVPRPAVSVRKQGQKKGGEPEEMDAVLDLNALDDEGQNRFGLADAWFPLDTAVHFMGDAFEVQLTEKKNELFGKVESAWK